MLSYEALDAQPVNGVSWFFILIFFAPLALVVVSFFVYCVFARRSVVRVARFLSLLWLVACVPACLMLLMGHAFNPSGKSTFVVIPLWVASGLAGLWIPVGLRKLFRIEPV